MYRNDPTPPPKKKSNSNSFQKIKKESALIDAAADDLISYDKTIKNYFQMAFQCFHTQAPILQQTMPCILI